MADISNKDMSPTAGVEVNAEDADPKAPVQATSPTPAAKEAEPAAEGWCGLCASSCASQCTSALCESLFMCGKRAQRSGEDDEDNGVGVLGWFGFAVINSAAQGIVAVSTLISWRVGFAFCVAYVLLTMSIAICLRRGGARFRSFQNLLWVITCWFIFIAGVYLALNVVAPGFGGDSWNGGGGGFSSSVDNDLTKLLPDDAAPDLVAWAQRTDYREANAPTFGQFDSAVYFSGMDSSTDGYSSVLMRFRPGGEGITEAVPKLTSPRNFLNYDSKLFFLATGPTEPGSDELRQNLWNYASGSGTTPAGSLFPAELETGVSGSVYYSRLIVWPATGAESKLWLRASYWCEAGSVNVQTIITTDGTTGGTTNLRSPACPEPATEEPTTPTRNPLSSDIYLWSIIGTAFVPMLIAATLVLIFARMPGMFMNLYIGVGSVVIMIYVIYMDNDSFVGLGDFLKWFLTSYSAVAYAAIVLATLLIENLPQVLDEMQTWISVFAGVLFCVMIHIDLEVPITDDFLPWLAYFALALLQMTIAVVITDQVPMILGAICLFVIAYKIAFEITAAFFGSTGTNPFATLIFMSLLAVQGIGIVGAAIAYSSKREEIDNALRSRLLCCLSKRRRAVKIGSRSSKPGSS